MQTHESFIEYLQYLLPYGLDESTFIRLTNASERYRDDCNKFEIEIADKMKNINICPDCKLSMFNHSEDCTLGF